MISCDSALTRVTTLFGAASGGDVVEDLVGLARRLTISLKVSSLGSDGVGDLDGDAVARRAALERLDRERGLVAVGTAGSSALAAGASDSPLLSSAPIAHDVRDAAAVEEVAVHGVGEVRALDEAAEVGVELGPVRDEDRFVDRALLGEADERRDCGADALDRLRAGGHLLHVDTG